MLGIKKLNARIGLKTDTLTNWRTSSIVPIQGEFIWVSDLNNFKIGDGSSSVTSLPYAIGASVLADYVPNPVLGQGKDLGQPVDNTDSLNVAIAKLQNQVTKVSEIKLEDLNDVTITGRPAELDSIAWQNGAWRTLPASELLTENVTYTQLKQKLDAAELTPGKLYSITDYVTTTGDGENPDITGYDITYKSAMHPFDLIVMATSTYTLDCQAKAVLHTGDTYFSSSDLFKWQIWYDINNDTSKYEWADSTNGKGVIYRMIDEYGNDCPYDFKNIQYRRKLTNGKYDPEHGTWTWVYTFGGINDGSLSSPNTTSSNNNVLRGTFNRLPNIVFLGRYCYRNTFGIECFDITFGDNCSDNTFGNTCNSNTFGNNCNNNTFGNDCYNITFGDNCSRNTFGNNCNNNTFGNYCFYNTFGNDCYNITFGDSNNQNGNYIQSVIIESGNQFIRLYSSGESYLNYLKNIYIAQGVNGSSGYRVISSIERNLNYRTTVGRATDGTIRIYNEDDPVSSGSSALSELSDTDIVNASSGQALVYNGTNWVNRSVSTELIESITYAQLVSKIAENNGEGNLEPGKLYRITDYVTTVNSSLISSCKSKGIPFDLIVMATSSNKLDSQVKAIAHRPSASEPTPEDLGDMSKWQIWYDINNDTDKYQWADSTAGKGVIYRMTDEYGNDCPYDFKNIQFFRAFYGSQYWLNTFSVIDDVAGTRTVKDASVCGQAIDNVIKPSYITVSGNDGSISITQVLNSNFFYCSSNELLTNYPAFMNNELGVSSTDNRFMGTCWNVTFGDRCNLNTIAGATKNVTFGDRCISNTITGATKNVTFGDRCNLNTIAGATKNVKFGNACNDNIVGDIGNTSAATEDIIFGNNCHDNSIVAATVSNIRVGNNCYYANLGTVEGDCNNIVIGDNCNNINMGPGPDHITIGDDCTNIDIGEFASAIHIGDACSGISVSEWSYHIDIGSWCSSVGIYDHDAADYNVLAHISVRSGVRNTTIDHNKVPFNSNVWWTVAENSSGTVKIYNEADLVP